MQISHSCSILSLHCFQTISNRGNLSSSQGTRQLLYNQVEAERVSAFNSLLYTQVKWHWWSAQPFHLCTTMQVHSLKEKGLKAECLGSGQVDETIESKVLTLVMCKLHFWPLSGYSMEINYIKCRCSLWKAELGRVIAIDQAHLVFDWATFRSKYSLVESMKEDFPTFLYWHWQLQHHPKCYLN